MHLSSSVPDPVSVVGRQRRRDSSLLWLSLAIIVLSLTLLVIVPFLVQRRSHAIWEGIQVLIEADQQAREMSFSLAREMSLLRGFLLDGDSLLLGYYHLGHDAESGGSHAFATSASTLPATIRDRHAEASDLIARWHTAVELELASGHPLRERAETQVFSRPLYLQALRASTQLRDAIEGALDAESRRLAAEERAGMMIQVMLGLMALLSTALVVWLGNRLLEAFETERRLHGQAVESNAARARLLRGVTHDLKNPLGSADLYAQMLQSGMYGEVPGPQRMVMERVRGSIGQVLALVHDLLDLSQAEAGALEIEREPVGLAGLLRSMEADFSNQAVEAGLSLEVRAPENLPPAEGDARRVRQILQNLIENAIKYTPAKGRVRVVLSSSASGPADHERGWLVVEVVDSGPGIPAEQRDRLFDEFVRLPGTARTVRGSGLGLTISRELARLMGGEITLRSEPGQGSCFVLWLPRAGEAAAPEVSLNGAGMA